MTTPEQEQADPHAPEAVARRLRETLRQETTETRPTVLLTELLGQLRSGDRVGQECVVVPVEVLDTLQFYAASDIVIGHIIDGKIVAHNDHGEQARTMLAALTAGPNAGGEDETGSSDHHD